jgi:hypothetical protein
MSIRKLQRDADLIDRANFMALGDGGFVYGETFYQIVNNRKRDCTIWRADDWFRGWLSEKGCKQIFIQDRSRGRNYKISIADFYNKAVDVGNSMSELYLPMKYWSKA